MKILIIDDDLITTEWVDLFLNSKNIETRKAHSIPGAIESLSTWQPNLILSDVSLDGQHVFSFLDFLASSDQTNHIPVIALTGYSLKDSEKGRFQGYLMKPVDPEMLLKLIHQILPEI